MTPNDAIVEKLAERQWTDVLWSAHSAHEYHHECAICTGDIRGVLAALADLIPDGHLLDVHTWEVVEVEEVGIGRILWDEAGTPSYVTVEYTNRGDILDGEPICALFRHPLHRNQEEATDAR